MTDTTGTHHDVSVIVNHGKMFVDSRSLANPLDIRHRNILELIRTHEDKFLRLGVLPFGTEERQTLYGPRRHVYVELNEDQAYLLLTLVRNSPKSTELKTRLIEAFRDTRKALADRDRSRLEGKKIRKLETDSIAKLVEYASARGSQHAELYYVHLSKLVNKVIGIEAGKRDELDEITLRRISVAETIAEMTVRDCIAAGLDYKDIYQVVKNRVNDLGPILNPNILVLKSAA